MGYGTYATIADLKGVLGITSTTDDTVMRKELEAASRSIDNYCNRYFNTKSAVVYFNGDRTLWLPDLLSITTIKTDEDGDGTFENTLATTDYIEYGHGIEDALNVYPRTRLEISHDSDYGSFASSVKKGVRIEGVFGYGDGISATPYVVDTTLTAAISSTTATTCTVTAVTNLSAGNTILIDSEQMYIYSISTLTLTVERGVNGTTAATHSNSVSLYIYQYPSDIRQACIALGVALYQNRAKQGIQSEHIGDYSYNLKSPYSEGGKIKSVIQTILDDSILGYKRMRV